MNIDKKDIAIVILVIYCIVLMKKYSIIYADPPWSYNDKFIPGGALSHYDVLEDDKIKKLPVEKIADDNCILFLWATFPKIQEALDVIEAWGFKYKTVGFVWVKKNKKKDSLFWGLGSWTRSNSEVCLIGIKGNPKRKSMGVHSVVISKYEGHSKKPDEVRKRIVELCGDLPRIELFARQKKGGWDVWGNEVENDIELWR